MVAPDAGGDHVNDENSNPRTGREPQFRNPGAKGQARSPEQAARTDPCANQRRDQHVDGYAAAGHHEILVGLDRATFVDADAKKHQHVNGNDGDIDHQATLLFCFVRADLARLS